MSDNESNRQEPCCQGDACCQPTGTDGGKQEMRWRTPVFIVVVLSAIIVGAYSLFWRGNDVADSGCCPSGSAGCVTDSTKPPVIEGLDEQLEGADLALVVFQQAGSQLSQNAIDALDATRMEVEAKGTHAQMLYLDSLDPAYAVAIDQYKVASLPAVLVCGRNNRVVLALENISKDAMLQIYEQGLKATPACGASASGQSQTRDSSGVD